MELYTKQERKNHVNFINAILIQFVLLAIIGFSIKEQIIILASLGLGCIMANTIWIFYIGYSHGWELKRISMKEDETY
jgi:hypothetical protein